MITKEVAEQQIADAFNHSSGLITASLAYIEPYLRDHMIRRVVDGEKFRTELSALHEGAVNEVSKYINEAFVSFNTRAQNASIDFSESSPDGEDSDSFSSAIQSYSDRLGQQAEAVVTRVGDAINKAVFSRPLLRMTGNRSFPTTVAPGKVLTLSYEFQNIGGAPFEGWLNVFVSDEYKKTQLFDTPQPVVLIRPNEVGAVKRDFVIEKVVQVKGNPRTWGKKTRIQSSIYSRPSS